MLTDMELIELENLIKLKHAELARTNLWAFNQFMDPKFFTEAKQHCKTIAGIMMQMSKKQIMKVNIAIPPRWGKSYTVSHGCAWMIGNNPSGAIMRNSYGADITHAMSYDVRAIVQKPNYQLVFPDVRISKNSSALDNWRIESDSTRPTYFGAGVGGALTGKGCSVLACMDDAHKNFEEAMSPTIQEKTFKWWQSTHLSRIEGAPQLNINTRWCKKDLAGRIQEVDPDWYNLTIPALNEVGVSSCEEVESTESLLSRKRILDSFIWSAEYMQNPIDAIGVLFSKEELKRFHRNELHSAPVASMMVADTADEGSNFLAAVFFYQYGDNHYFIVDVVYNQEKVEFTEPVVAQKIIDHRVDMALFESNNGGKQYARNVTQLCLEHGSRAEIGWRANTKNKETRILMKAGYVKQYFYFLHDDDIEPGTDYWRFMEHLTSYNKQGGNKYDDAPDGVTIAAEFVEMIRNNQEQGGHHGTTAR